MTTFEDRQEALRREWSIFKRELRVRWTAVKFNLRLRRWFCERCGRRYFLDRRECADPECLGTVYSGTP
jgi:hypothetical protein